MKLNKKNKNRDKLTIALLIAIISALHYLTLEGYWPIHDFYRRLYYLPIILSAFKFRLKGGFIASLVVVFIYAPHLTFYFGEINIQVINQFLELGMFMIIGMITGYLVEKDHQKRGLLEFQIIQLANLENYTHNILDSLHSGVIAMNKDYSMPMINKKALLFFGTTQEMHYFLEKEGLQDKIDQILEGKIEAFETEAIYSKEQGEINFTVEAYPINNIAGEIEGAVLVVHDITKIKELQQQVKRSERLSAIGQLASGIAHEVRNPLGIIKTIGQTLGDDIEDEEVKEGLEIINHEIDRANKVIKELLDFAKPYKYQVKEESLENLLSELLVLTKKFGEQKGVTINLKVTNNCWIEGDIDKLKQAFLNILLNGVQAMVKGGSLNIKLQTIDDEWAMVDFIDEGEGIPKEILDKIFNPFFTTKDYGTGLGLSITHRIIEEHEGKMEINSAVGKGTTVKVYLPLDKKEDGDAEKSIDR